MFKGQVGSEFTKENSTYMEKNKWCMNIQVIVYNLLHKLRNSKQIVVSIQTKIFAL